MVARAPSIASELPLFSLCFLRSLLGSLAASDLLLTQAKQLSGVVLVHEPYASLGVLLSGSAEIGFSLRLSEFATSAGRPDFEIVFQLVPDAAGALASIYPVSYKNFLTQISFSYADAPDAPRDPILCDFAAAWLNDLNSLGYLAAAKFGTPLLLAEA